MDLTPLPRAVLFDKDGTLFGFEVTWAGFAADLIAELSAGDLRVQSALEAALGFDVSERRFHTSSIAIAGTSGEVAAAAARVLDLPAAEIEAHIDARARAILPVEVTPLAPLMKALKHKGLSLGVATNDTEAAARAHLASVGADSGWACILGADSGYAAKPAPDMLLGFAEAVGCAPEDVVMVGDSLHDLEAARAAGMRAVGVLTGMADAATLAPFAEVVLPDISALPGWLFPAP